MDQRDFKKAILAIRWDERYLKKRNGCEKSKSSFFLAQTHHIDPDFRQAITDQNIAAGDLLDIGTGLGSQAINFAQIGFQVTATDVSSIALAQANIKAGEENVKVAFIYDNILHTALDKGYDIITDRGCLTTLGTKHYADYCKSVSRLLRHDGHFFLKIDEKRDKDVIEAIEKVFRVKSAKSTIYQGEATANIKAKFYYLTHFQKGNNSDLTML